MNAIILDGEQGSALAATRSLGNKGINVTVGAETARSLSSSSRYCKKSFLYPTPYEKSDDFINCIINYANNGPDAVLFPMTDITLCQILRRRDNFGSHIKIPFVEYENYLETSDKVSLFYLANKLNIPIPRTIFIHDNRDVEDNLRKIEKMGFPLVIKPFRSKIEIENHWIHADVKYIKNMEELKSVLREEPFKSFPFLIQEKIDGYGLGIFLLMKDGKVVARFAHKRIREKPPSGGVSVLCESIIPTCRTMEDSIRLLQLQNWYGIAMIEYKFDNKDNIPKLMEVNARFWGSLQLAISSGVDFPYMLFCLASGKEVDVSESYEIGMKSRWELGDLDHFLIRLRKKPEALFLPDIATTRFDILKDLIQNIFKFNVKNEILKKDDPNPFYFELKQYLKNMIK